MRQAVRSGLEKVVYAASDEFLASLSPGELERPVDLTAIKNSPGCRSCQLLRSTDNPGHLAIIEEWESIEAHQNAEKAIPPEKLNQAMAMFAKPPSGTYYKA